MAIQIDTGLLELLPDFYAPVKEYQQIMTAEEAELAELAGFINAVNDNFFVQTADEDTIASWEQLLGIAVGPDDTLEFRRVRIINRLTTNPPFTLPLLKSKLDALLGPDSYTLTMDYENYALYIQMAVENQSYAVEVAYTINQIKPAHIIYIAATGLYDGLFLSEVIRGSTLTYNYSLGRWFLGQKPFVSYAESETYKMAGVSSVKPGLINGSESSILSLVNKVRLNGSVIIPNSDITKTTSTGGSGSSYYSVAEFAYDITPQMVSSVTKIELLASDNTVLTSAAVYIPVGSVVRVTSTIRVEEAR